MSVGYDKMCPERLSDLQGACLAKLTDSFALYPFQESDLHSSASYAKL